MALPWLIGAAAAAFVTKKIYDAVTEDDDDSSSVSRREVEEKAAREAEKERKKAAKKVQRQYLSEQFNMYCHAAQSQIEYSLSPYFSIEFHGMPSIQQAENSNSVKKNTDLGGNIFPYMQSTVKNLAYVQQQYDAEVTPDIELHYALQDIEECEVLLQEIRELKQAIERTVDAEIDRVICHG